MIEMMMANTVYEPAATVVTTVQPDRESPLARAFGELRLGAMMVDSEEEGATKGFAAGAKLGVESANFHGFSAAAAARISQNIEWIGIDDEEMNPEFFDENLDSFAYLSEAFIAYDASQVQARIGRFAIETPFADSDDIRMAPNTFEGAWLQFQPTEALNLQLLYLQRWAGFDSGEDQDRFKALVNAESFGAAGAGVVYTLGDTAELGVWHYHVDAMASLSYAEATGTWAANDAVAFEYGLQGALISQHDDSGVEGRVAGAFVAAESSGFFGAVAYNHAWVDEGEQITDGFGGGPFYTSLDEQTLAALSEAAPGEEVSMARFALGADLDVYVGGLSVEAVYGHAESKQRSAEIDEYDLVVNYAFDERLQVEAIGVVVEDRAAADADAGFERLVVRATYAF